MSNLLLQYLGNSPQLRLINFFLDSKSDYSKKEIIESVGISKTTFYNVWPILEKSGIFVPGRKFGNVQLYSLNKESAIIKQFVSLDSELNKQAIPQASNSEKNKS